MAPKERINREISVDQVRLISETGDQVGVVGIRQALQAAEDAGLDLVEIAPGAKPPVCKIMDFGKYYYQKERNLREAKKKQHVVQIKEVKFGPNTEEHDYEFKKKNAVKFLKQHNKVKFTVRFKGRQLAHKDMGYNVLERLVEDLKEIAEIDKQPENEARSISMVMAPRKDIDSIIDSKDETKE